MENTVKRAEFKKALNIGIICILSYLTSYYMRNILSVTTPEMESSGAFSKELIGLFGSVYMLVYAAGQLFNGVLGDKVKPRTMICTGMTVASVSLIAFPFAGFIPLQILCFAALGYGLSMLRGPLMKVISENTLPDHARNICVFFSAAGFAGPFVATLFAFIFDWKYTYVAAGILTLIIAACAYAMLSYLEQRGLISSNASKKHKGLSGISVMFRLEKFIFYMIIGGIVEISMTAVGMWLPTYFEEHLGFASDMSNLLYSLLSLVKSFAPFLALLLFRRIGERDIPIIRYSFAAGFVFFGAMIFVQNPWGCVALVLLARVAVGFASAMLWSIYIPSLGKSGVVSGANGVLDCSGYIFAAIANSAFSLIAARINSWNAVVVIWAALMVAGVAATFFVKDGKNVSEANAD